MSLLDGFEAFDFSEGAPYVSVTRNGVTFNRAVVLKLENPRFVTLLINSQTHQIAVQASDESNPKAVPFFKEKKSGQISVRWNSKDLLFTISSMMDWDLDSTSYRVTGMLYREEKTFIFNFDKAEILK